MRLCGSMSWDGVCVVCCAECDSVVNINITLVKFSASSLIMVEDRNM